MYKRLISVYPHNDKESWVSCHNDLKPENILFDRQRPRLVDWESTFQNHRYLGLAVVANFVVKTDDLEAEFLKTYLLRDFSEYERARLYVVSQILHIHYFAMFAPVGSENNPVNLDGITKYQFREFNDRMWNGEIYLKENNAKLQYAPGAHEAID